MVRTLSLAQIVDSEARRLGLDAWEVINLLEVSIQRPLHAQRAQCSHNDRPEFR